MGDDGCDLLGPPHPADRMEQAHLLFDPGGREGQASGANNAIRELGGVFGVAVLASVFTSYGGYESGQTFVDGLGPAIYVGAVVVGIGALAALFIPRKRRPAEFGAVEPAGELVPAAEAA